MGNAQRQKGLAAERQVFQVLVHHGFTVRGLESAGDWLAFLPAHGELPALTLHVEVKRHEVLRLPLWTRQAVAEAPLGVLPVVIFRKSRQPWQAVLPEKWIAGRTRGGRTVHGGIDYSLQTLNGEWWARLTLADLLDIICDGRTTTTGANGD